MSIGYIGANMKVSKKPRSVDSEVIRLKMSETTQTLMNSPILKSSDGINIIEMHQVEYFCLLNLVII